MLCLFTSKPFEAAPIKSELLANGFLVYTPNFNIPDLRGNYTFSLPVTPSIFVVDAIEDLRFAEKLTGTLKEAFPSSRAVLLIDREQFQSERFRHLPFSDFEIKTDRNYRIADEMKRIFRSLDIEYNTRIRKLSIDLQSRTAYLHGAAIKLTPAEMRILLLLCNTEKEHADESLILSCCFAESYRMVVSNVRAHVSGINKKSQKLFSRKLILCDKNEGYYINPYM